MRHWQKLALVTAIISIFYPISVWAQDSGDTPSNSGDGRIDISVTPERIILGETANAHVEANVVTHDGEMLSCEDIRLHTSQGYITNIAQKETGQYTAQYVLPEDFFPRFALIAAFAKCANQTITGSLVVKLYGTGKVGLTLKPNTEAVLQIANEQFGPHTTDDNGNVTIPIVVPPGVKNGTVDGEPIDLNLPPVNRIVAIPEKKGLSSDEHGGQVIVIYAIDDRTGNPLLKANLKVKPKRGKISKIVAAAPGVYRAYYTPPKKVGYGQDTVSIALRGDAVSETKVTMQLISGIPAKIAMNVHPKKYQAGNDTPLHIAVRLTDQNGNPTSGAVDVQSDFGEMASLRSVAPGQYRTTLQIPNNFKGKEKVRIVAMLSKNRGVKTETTVALIPAEPAAIAFSPVSDAVPADGYTVTGIPFKLIDKYDNPIPNAVISTSASRGTTSPTAVAAGDGYTLQFTPPLIRKRETGSATIRASIDDLHGELEVPLTAKTHVMGITPAVGYLTNLKHVHAPYFSLPIDWSLWVIHNGVHIGVDLGYYFSRGEFEEENYSTAFHALILGSYLGYRIMISPKIYLSPHAGMGIIAIRNKIREQSAYETTEGTARLYGRFSVETGIRLGPGYVALKLGFLIAYAKDLHFLHGHIGGLNMHLGYRFQLF